MSAPEGPRIGSGRGGAKTVTSPRLPPRPSEGFKRCPRCSEVKPLSEFHKESRRRLGVGSRCKPCQKEAKRESRKRHPLTPEQRERIRQNHDRWRAKNREKLREQWHRRKQDDVKYQRILDRARITSLEKRRARTEALGEVKRSLGCLFCGELEPVCLDLHHINREEKLFDVGSFGSSGARWERIRAEAAKCVVVCTNCHRKVHHGLIEVPSRARRVVLSEVDPAGRRVNRDPLDVTFAEVSG